MFDDIKKFRAKLDAGQLCLGVGIGLTDPAVTEALGDSVDFFWIDLEHSPLSVEALVGHLISARATGTPALVRVPSGEIGTIKRVLDNGAQGIILPQAHSADDVRQFVSACRYPPLGTRGYGPRRPSNYGRDGGVEYLARANRQLFVAAQIETVGAYQALDEILAIPTLDSLIVGPNDLSGSMGFPGQPRHPDVVKAIRTIAEKSRKAGKYVGIGMGADVDHALEAASLGVQWVQCGSDFGYMTAFADRLYADIRAKLGK